MMMMMLLSEISAKRRQIGRLGISHLLPEVVPRLSPDASRLARLERVTVWRCDQ